MDRMAPVFTSMTMTVPRFMTLYSSIAWERYFSTICWTFSSMVRLRLYPLMGSWTSASESATSYPRAFLVLTLRPGVPASTSS